MSSTAPAASPTLSNQHGINGIAAGVVAYSSNSNWDPGDAFSALVCFDVDGTVANAVATPTASSTAISAWTTKVAAPATGQYYLQTGTHAYFVRATCPAGYQDAAVSAWRYSDAHGLVVMAPDFSVSFN